MTLWRTILVFDGLVVWLAVNVWLLTLLVDNLRSWSDDGRDQGSVSG